jgi:hypothetical protein
MKSEMHSADGWFLLRSLSLATTFVMGCIVAPWFYLNVAVQNLTWKATMGLIFQLLLL